MADVATLGIKVDSAQAASAAGNLDKLSAASGRAETSTQKLARSVGTSEEKMSRYVATAARVGAVIAAAAVAAGAALALMVKNTLSAVDEQAKLARQLGGTIDGLRGLQIAAEDAGVDTGALAASLGRFQAVLGEAERGTGTAVEALQRLGLSGQELSALDIDERLAVIVERMDALGLSASQSADLLRQFGIRNSEMLRLVQGGAAAIRQARADVDEFGLSISQVDAAGIERANDSMGRISRTAEVFITRITVALAPALELAANWFNELARQNQGWRTTAEGAADAVITGISYVADAIQTMRIAWQAAEYANASFNMVTITGLRLILEAVSLLSDSVDSSAFMATLREEAATATDEVASSFEELRRIWGEEMPSGGIMRALEEARAAAGSGEGALPLADIALGAGEVTAAVEVAAAAVEDLRTKADVLKDIDALRSSMMGDEEAMIAQRDARLDLLREGLEMEAITRDEYRALEQASIAEFDDWRMAQEQQVANDRAATEARVQSQIISMREQAVGNAVALLQVLGQKNKLAAIAAIALSKGLMIAQTIMSGAAAEIRALAELGPIAGAAAAAEIRAWTIANVALIAATGLAQAAGSSSTQSAGGAPGGGGSIGPAAAAPAQAARAQDVTVRIDSDRNLFTRADIQQIIDGISDAVGDGANLRLASA